MNKHDAVLIIEPHTIGHHGPWLQWISRGLTGTGRSVIIQTLKQSASHPSISNLNRCNFDVIEMSADMADKKFQGAGAISFARREFAYWQLFHNWYSYAIKHVGNVDLVFMPYLDYCLYSIGLRGSPFGKTPWAGLAMRPAFHYTKTGILAPHQKLQWIKNILFFRMLDNRYLRAFFTIDEPFGEYLQISHKRKATFKAHFIAEPADFSDLPQQSVARAKLSLPQDRKLILVYGALDKRKGIVELVTALQNREFPNNADIMLVGEQMTDIQPFIACENVNKLIANGRVRLFRGFIPTHEQGLYFAAADVIWLGYKSFYNPSGVLVQAARAGRPVIACREGVIGWQVQRHHCGLLVDPEDNNQVARAINILLTNSVVAQECGSNGLCAFAANTEQQAVDCLSRYLA